MKSKVLMWCNKRLIILLGIMLIVVIVGCFDYVYAQPPKSDDNYWDLGCGIDWGWYGHVPTEQQIEQAIKNINLDRINQLVNKVGRSPVTGRISEVIIGNGCEARVIVEIIPTYEGYTGIETYYDVFQLRPIYYCDQRYIDFETWEFAPIYYVQKGNFEDAVSNYINSEFWGASEFHPSCYVHTSPPSPTQDIPPPGSIDTPVPTLPPGGDDLPPPPPPSGDGGLWAVVVGGLVIMGVAAAGIGAVGVAGAAAVLVRRAKLKQPERQQDGQQDTIDDQEIVGYILELSTNQVFLQEKRPQTVRVTCWKVRANGAYERAPEAAIVVQAPPPLSNITVSPLNGQGSMDVQFKLEGESNAETHQVMIVASGGGESASAVVTINLMPALEMTLTTHDGSTHLEIGEEGLWACAQIVSDTASPGNQSDLKTPNIRFRVDGPNASWINLGEAVYRDKWQWVYVEARPPHQGAQLERGNPVLIAEYHEEHKKIHIQEHMILELQTEYQLRVKLFDSKTSDIEYHRGQGEWQAPDVLVYWVNPSLGDTPVEPDFDYGFDDPPLRIEPPCLSLESFSEYAPHQYRMQFQVVQDLEQFFGEDLVEKDGMVKIVIEAIDQEQEKHFAVHDCQVRPMAIPIIYFWQETPSQKVEQREHYGVSLGEGEMVSDGEDSLGVGAFLVRVDRMADFDLAYEHPLALTQLPKAELSGVDSSKYRLHDEPEDENSYRYAGRVKTDQEEPVFYQSQEHAMKLRVDLALDQQRYPNYFYNQHPSQMQTEVKPNEVYLKLWVFPGTEIGTSAAGGFLFLPTKKVPLVGKELTLDIQSRGSRLTADQTIQQTDGEGLARWTLSYQGMNWKNYRSSIFTVRCGVPKPKGGYKGTQVQINIGKNVDQFVADVYKHRRHRDLNLENPDFETGSGFFATVADYIWPDFLCGPVNNIIDMVTNNYSTYVCYSLAYRIIRWWGARRTGIKNFDETQVTSMNGFDMAQYILGLIPGSPHTFAGIFLANVDKSPTDDPRGIDPWWIQSWSREFRQRVDGLYTNTNQYTMQAGLYAALTLLALLSFKFAAWWQGPEVAMSLKKRIMGVIFSGGGSLTWARSQGITVRSDGGHIQGKRYIRTSHFDFSYDPIPSVCDSLKQKGVPAVKPIVEW